MNNEGADHKGHLINHKIREFEWFQIETQVRQFVSELMQPTLRQFSEDRQYSEAVKKNIEENNKSLQQLKNIILKSEEKIPIFEEIADKFYKLETKVDIGDKQLNQTLEKVKSDVSSVLIDVTQQNQDMRNILQARDHIITQNIRMSQGLTNFQADVSSMLAKMNGEIINNEAWLRTNINKVQENLRFHSNKLIDINNNIQSIEDKIKDIRTLNTEFSNQHGQHFGTTESLQSAVATIQANLQTARKFTNRVEENSAQLKQFQNFVDQYIPVYLQAQISETLFTIVDAKLQKQLVQYQEQKFPEFSQAILEDDGNPHLEQKIIEATHTLEIITRRNQKYLNKLQTRIHQGLAPDSESQDEISMLYQQKQMQLNEQNPLYQQQQQQQQNDNNYENNQNLLINQQSNPINSVIPGGTPQNRNQLGSANSIISPTNKMSLINGNLNNNNQDMFSLNNSIGEISFQDPDSRVATTNVAGPTLGGSAAIPQNQPPLRGSSSNSAKNNMDIPKLILNENFNPTAPTSFSVGGVQISVSGGTEKRISTAMPQQNRQISTLHPSNINLVENNLKNSQEMKMSQRSSMMGSEHDIIASQSIQRELTSVKAVINEELRMQRALIQKKSEEHAKSIVDVEEQMVLHIMQIQDEIDQIDMGIKQFISEQALERGHYERKIEGLWQEIEQIVDTFNILSETVHKLIHFCTLINHLSIQDEIDQQGLALFGLRETYNENPIVVGGNDPNQTNPQGGSIQNSSSLVQQQNVIHSIHNQGVPASHPRIPSITLDNKCFSCSGQSSNMMGAFQMACLAYNPSNVVVEGQEYKRDELLEVSTKILHSAQIEYGINNGSGSGAKNQNNSELVYGSGTQQMGRYSSRENNYLDTNTQENPSFVVDVPPKTSNSISRGVALPSLEHNSSNSTQFKRYQTNPNNSNNRKSAGSHDLNSIEQNKNSRSVSNYNPQSNSKSNNNISFN